MSAIKSQLRKDEKFSQGICLHAVYQIAPGMDAKDLEAGDREERVEADEKGNNPQSMGKIHAAEGS